MQLQAKLSFKDDMQLHAKLSFKDDQNIPSYHIIYITNYLISKNPIQYKKERSYHNIYFTIPDFLKTRTEGRK